MENGENLEFRRHWDSRMRNFNIHRALSSIRASVMICIAILEKPLFFPVPLTDGSSGVGLEDRGVSTEGGRVNRYAKHVLNCLKPRHMLYLTTAYFKVCQLWGVSELPVSLSEHAHENNCEWLILITADWGQILGCVDGFYYPVSGNCLS